MTAGLSTRRRFLAGAGTAGAAVIAATGAAAPSIAAPDVVPDADAELIARCAEFDAHQRYFVSLFPGGANVIEDEDDRDDAIAEFRDDRAEAWERLCEQRATTPAGFKALAATIVGFAPELADTSASSEWDRRMIAVLLAGLTRDSAAS